MKRCKKRFARAVTFTALLGALAPTVGSAAAGANTISLAGEWRFRLDPENLGTEKKWFQKNLPDAITLPGSTDQNGYGHRTTEKELWHLTRTCQYVGPAWYQRDVTIPEAWKGKRITLLLERCHWETRLWVGDNGVGIDPQDLPHVFDRFYRGKNSGKEGSGLGLAIVKSIADLQGGTITVESELGEGSTFTLHLPLEESQ